MSAEFIQIDRLIITIRPAVIQVLDGSKFHNAVILIQFQTGSVHPWCIPVHECQGIPGILKKQIQNRFFKDQIGFQKQGIFLKQIVFCKRKGINVVRTFVNRIMKEHDRCPDSEASDMVHQFLSLVSFHDHDPGQCLRVKLTKHPLYQRHASYPDHAFCIMARQFAEPFSHTGC